MRKLSLHPLHLIYLTTVMACGTAFGTPVGEEIAINTVMKARVLSENGNKHNVEIFANPELKPEGELQIPFFITQGENEYTVTRIAEKGFKQCNLTSVTLPLSIQSIGEEAFYGCTKLAEVMTNEDNELHTIGDYAFAYTYALKDFDMENVTSIGKFTFMRTGMETVSMPSVKTIDAGAFQEAQELHTVYTGDALTSISSIVFYNCPKLKSVELRSPLKEIGVSAFGNCPSLKDIVMPRTLRTVGERAFRDCGLERIFIITYDFPRFCEASELLNNKSVKKIYAHRVVAEDVKNFLADGTDENPVENLADAEVLQLDDVLHFEGVEGKMSTFKLIPKIDGITDIHLFTFKDGVELFPNAEGIYSVAAQRAYVEYRVDGINYLDYFDNLPITEEAGIDSVTTTESGPVYYDLQGNRLTNPAKYGIFIESINGKNRKIVR